MNPQRRAGDRWPISRAFLAAVLLAAGVIVKNPKEPESYATAFGIVAAAVSGGVRKNGDQR